MPTRRELAVEHRMQRRNAKERLRALRHELREARQRRKQALFDARERCRAERLALRERLRATRMRLLAELRETRRAERRAVRAKCVERRQEARSAGKSDVARVRASLAAERRELAEMRKVARAERMRLAQAPACITSRRETDDEVFAAIPPDLAPLFLRVKGAIKGKGRLSRTEAFLRYAESHPEEVLAVSQHPVDARVQELERRERALTREAGLKPSLRETRKAARLDRMRARADRRRSETAEETCGCATGIANISPTDQASPSPAFGLAHETSTPQAGRKETVGATSLADPPKRATPKDRDHTRTRAAARSKGPRAIVIENPKDRDHTRFGQHREGETLKDTTVTIVPGRRIEIVHVVPPGHRSVKDPVTGRHVPNAEAFTVKKTFEIGDVAEVGGYNLTYTGIVRGITPKTITVVEHEGTSMEKTYRLSIYLFARMNWDFDAETTARRNAETSATM